MGIIDKIVSTVATNSIVKNVGKTAVITTGGILNEVDQHRQNVNATNVKPVLINVYTVNNYVGGDYLKASTYLAGLGFTNVTLVPKKDLINGWITKDGTVEQIVIGGITEFKRKTKFPPNTPVMITYHTFKSSTASVRQVTPTNNDVLTSNNIKSSVYCTSCGKENPISSNFCFNCGTKLTK